VSEKWLVLKRRSHRRAEPAEPPARECLKRSSLRSILDAGVFAISSNFLSNKPCNNRVTYSEDLMDSPLNVTQLAVFKILSSNFQREMEDN
jgi:hypothetical protein